MKTVVTTEGNKALFVEKNCRISYKGNFLGFDSGGIKASVLGCGAAFIIQ
jgi:hypothetical protein